MSKKIGFLYPVTTIGPLVTQFAYSSVITHIIILYLLSILSLPRGQSLVFDSACHFCCNITYAVLYTLHHVHRLRAIAPTYWIDRRLSSTSTNHRRRRRLELCGPISLVCVCAFLWMRISYINWWWRSSKASFNR